MKLPLLFTNRYARKDLYDTVRCWFKPCQKWLTKEIPNTWCDKTELIPRLLFTCLINFVEEEKGLDQLGISWESDLKAGYVTQAYVDDHTYRYGLLKKVYDYVKYERDFLKNLMNASYPDHLPEFLGGPVDNRPYEVKYAETNRLEKLIEDKDQWAMKSIVEQVGILWT